MPAPVIPAGIVPAVASYSFGGPDGAMRTEVAGGPARYGLDFDRGTQLFNVTLVLDENKFAAWSLFYHRVIAKGTIAFEMRLDSGLGPEPHLCNIVPGTYSAARTGGIITSVAFVVEAESTVYAVAEADVQDRIELYLAGGSRLLGRLAKFATVDSKVLDF